VALTIWGQHVSGVIQCLSSLWLIISRNIIFLRSILVACVRITSPHLLRLSNTAWDISIVFVHSSTMDAWVSVPAGLCEQHIGGTNISPSPWFQFCWTHQKWNCWAV
jgi:hypothetical protein